MSYILVFCIPLGDALSLSKMNASLGRKIAWQATGIPLGMHPYFILIVMWSHS
ncbi:MAG: hypothetical protein FWH18_09235 [Marinilabiliaceae bacterium]|nr:hypothetical protein [Marinilabiliaceae bacterium]